MRMSFNNPGYVTSGFQAEIPLVVQVCLMSEIDRLSRLDSEEVDYLQIFELTRKIINGNVYQEIVVEQEQPPKKHKICFPFDDAVTRKVYCIDSEEYHTYLLAEEY